MSELPVLVDSHCHLADPKFADDLDAVMENAARAGIERILTVSTKQSNLDATLEIAERFPQVYFSAGVHPHYVAKEPMATVAELTELSKHPKMAAIGETGLDYHYTREIAEEQKESFAIHIEASRRTGLPLVVHSRSADQDTGRILSEEFKREPFGCVLHCFSSGRGLAALAAEHGFYLSMSGIATFPKSGELRDIFSSMPLDRILVETDAPYLAPVPNRGKRNEPAYTAHTAEAGAELFGLDANEFRRQTTLNFNRLFRKAAVGVGR